ncbi:MAG: uracil phosphoribosyltransferase [Pseudoclavibacter sp.]|nr:uracil phosphoribosyltransferase [Pseudoclavibacter sp.]
MRVHVVRHPLISHKLTMLRDASTPSPIFRALVDELVTLLGYEATREVRLEEMPLHTPVAQTRGLRVSSPKPLVVPIIRAGLGMLDGFVRLMPSVEVGFLGIRRDEQTLQPETYAKRLPGNLDRRRCFVLDPMLATGGSLAAAVQFLLDAGAGQVTAICLVAAPEGLELMERRFADRDVTIVLGALDDGLTEQGFITPGLGDAGDRLYGVTD